MGNNTFIVLCCILAILIVIIIFSLLNIEKIKLFFKVSSRYNDISDYVNGKPFQLFYSAGFDTLLGFRTGDSFDFVISMNKRFKFISDDEMAKINSDKDLYDLFDKKNKFEIKVCEEKIKWIKEILFIFDENLKLEEMSIRINEINGYSFEEIYKKIVEIISNKFKKGSVICNKGMYESSWEFIYSKISVNHSIPNIYKKEEKEELFVNFKRIEFFLLRKDITPLMKLFYQDRIFGNNKYH